MKQEIAAFMRRLYRQKLTTTSGGNISVKKDEIVFITPSGIDKGEIQSDQIAELDINGKIITTKHAISTETPMHLAIYQARPDIKAIVHAHPPYGTAYASSNKTLDSKLTSEGRLILGEIAFAKYALMGTEDLAKSVAKEALNSHVILMENHGVIALGETLLEAFDRLEVLEFTAKINYITETLNAKKGLSNQQIKEIDKLKS